MAKLMLSVPIIVEVVEGKKKNKLKVELRDLTKAEQKESQELIKKFQDISMRLERLSSKLASAKKKAEYSEKLEKFDDAIKYQERADTLEDDLQKLTKEITALGGDDFNEELSKKNFKRLVSGEDIEKLEEIAETKGYALIMPLLYQAKREVEGKQDDA